MIWTVSIHQSTMTQAEDRRLQVRTIEDLSHLTVPVQIDASCLSIVMYRHVYVLYLPMIPRCLDVCARLPDLTVCSDVTCICICMCLFMGNALACLLLTPVHVLASIVLVAVNVLLRMHVCIR